ncbi:MAG: cellulase family glycosylhydrolase [Clostridiales bacterium]|nr:cellulase family glycosylhydrolase [Clostridiales bacterium]
MNIPIRIHPENNKIFQFRGKPLVLVCATEHYGAVINRPFNFEKYLTDAVEKKQTLTRLFVLFRELQSYCNPYSTCKPESPDYISPFKRTGPGLAQDGELKYDLDCWNEEFFARLHAFLSLASEYGIIVEVTLLSNTYIPELWALNPLNSKNNVNDVEEIEFMLYNTQRNPKLFDRQTSHVCKIVEETNKYDNIIYEICNEPCGWITGSDSYPRPSEINEWQKAIAQVIRDTELKLPNKHLISGQEAFVGEPLEMYSDLSFASLGIDIVNIHPVPNTTYHGRSFDFGTFMSKQLKLRAVRDFCLATRDERKPLNLDEDNVASQYKDYDGWTIHRKRAWTTLLCGCHYDYIDFSIINYCETGTAASQKHIRSWMKHLSEFIHSIDLVHSKPMPDLVKGKPLHTVEAVLAAGDRDYCIYLADGRELNEHEAGMAINGDITIDLPQGNYRVSCYSPITGLYSPAVKMCGGDNLTIVLPEFVHDIVIRIIKDCG